MRLANYFILKIIPNNTDKNTNIHINISINTNNKSGGLKCSVL